VEPLQGAQRPHSGCGILWRLGLGTGMCYAGEMGVGGSPAGVRVFVVGGFSQHSGVLRGGVFLWFSWWRGRQEAGTSRIYRRNKAAPRLMRSTSEDHLEAGGLGQGQHLAEAEKRGRGGEATGP